MNIEDRLEKLSRIVTQERTKKEVKGEEILKLQLLINEKQADSRVLLQVAEVFKNLGGESQESLMDKLQKFVTFGLQSIFGISYSFVPVVDSGGKDVAVDFYVKTEDVQGRVVDAKGGGVAEVVSMLIQIFFMRVLRDEFSQVLILDTPMTHISNRYREKVSALLKQLSEKLNMQIVLLTNTKEFAEHADMAYEFTQRDGKTQVEGK